MSHNEAIATQPNVLSGAELGVRPDLQISVEWIPSSMDIESAQATFEHSGAAVIEGVVHLPGSEMTVNDVCEPLREHIVKKWAGGELDSLLRRKDYEAYNGTGRHMSTIAYERVVESLPEVMEVQRQLLALVRAINKDEATEISSDPDEGTVLNWQLFDLKTSSDHIQQHGAHTDRVDTTAVLPLANVGPNGNIVIIHGFTQACLDLGLDPHRNFNDNLDVIIRTDPTKVRCNALNVQPGSLVMLRTDQDIHLITPKSGADIEAGLAGGAELVTDGNLTLGRAIINMAFETQACRDIDKKAREIEERFSLHEDYRDHDEFFKRMDEALRTESLDQQTYMSIRSAIVTRLSAADLYGEKTT